MNENYTIDVNGLSYIELEELYGQSHATYTEELSIEFSSLYTENENKTEQE